MVARVFYAVVIWTVRGLIKSLWALVHESHLSKPHWLWLSSVHILKILVQLLWKNKILLSEEYVRTFLSIFPLWFYRRLVMHLRAFMHNNTHGRLSSAQLYLCFLSALFVFVFFGFYHSSSFSSLRWESGACFFPPLHALKSSSSSPIRPASD